MVPGEGPEVNFLPIFGFFNYVITDVRYEAKIFTDGLRLTITPLKDSLSMAKSHSGRRSGFLRSISVSRILSNMDPA